MRRINLLALTVVAAMLAGCGGGIRVQTDFDTTAEFSGYQTYQWAERETTGKEDPRGYNDLTARRIKLAVDRALQAKGFREAGADPDCFVAWHGAIDGKMSLTTIRDDYWYGWGWYGPGISTAQTYANEWDEGTLHIDIIDAGSWRGGERARPRCVKSATRSASRPI
jgi:hypothetical protein